MTTLFVAGILDNRETGYGVHTSDLLDALRRVSPWPIEAIDMGSRRTTGGYPGPDDVVVCVGTPELLTLFKPTGARLISLTMWESTVIPDGWHLPFSLADEIWTASDWGADVLRRNIARPHRVHVVPAGVDGAAFRPHGPTLPMIDRIEGFKFLHVGKAEPRKGTVELLYAFDRAFDDEPVYLVLACHNRFIPGFDTVRFLENMCLRRRRFIVPVQPLPDRSAVGALYRSCDAFVAPSRAEGWGLPALEAMASGLPTALTRYGGHAAFAHPGNSVGIPYTMAPIDRGALPALERADGNYGEWAAPDIDGLAGTLRSMAGGLYAERRMAAQASAAEIAERWSWDAAAQEACMRVGSILGGQLRKAG
ncbi:glycosyltransferase [Mesorhizobium sp. CAU 1732]|uniref:glycosyltransferase n=1 Tax=Mesorhizobium sp. CAU 1732 TaxID=3140358 RepID=UPI0032616903